MIEINDCSEIDAAYVSNNMREADKIEFKKVTGEDDFLKNILFGLNSKNSFTYCMKSNGLPFAILGCIEHEEFIIVWACGTNEVRNNAKSFILETKKLLDKHKNKDKPYINCVDCDNHDAVKFLRYVGFSILDPIPYGKMGSNFYPFIMG